MNSNDAAAMNQNRPDRRSGQPRIARMRWWVPATILLLAAASIVLIRHSSELDSNFKNMRTFLAGAITILLLLVWFMFFTRLRWRARFTAPCTSTRAPAASATSARSTCAAWSCGWPSR